MGLQRSKVTAVSDGSNAPKGWVKVELRGLGATTESDWVAWPGLFSGDGRGFWLPPKVGTRCTIGFDDSDELNLEPMVLCAYFDEAAVAPGTDLAKPRIKLGALEITFNEDDVALEIGGATYKLARADKVNSELSTLASAFNNHTHYYVVFVPTPTSTPLSAPVTPSDVSSNKVKVSS